MQRLRRAKPIALALFLALVSGAFAGVNEGATFTLTSSSTISGVGPGETVRLEIDVANFVDVKQLDVYITVSDPAAFDMGSVRITPPGEDFNALSGQLVSGTTDRVRVGAAYLDVLFTGDGAMSLRLKTAADFTADTEATVTVDLVSLGPSSTERDEFSAAVLGLSLQLNPPISDPTLVATSAADISTDFSSAGGSEGEVTLSVAFTDAAGAAASGQAITWTVVNNGAETILVGATEVAANAQTAVDIATVDGVSTLTVDAEGDRSAGSTSATITASTTANNSEGTAQTLSAAFSVTWDVPVPAELASFAADVTIDEAVQLQWAVSSQTNNLGWEVYRSADNDVFERVSGLISGDGTSDAFRSYEYLDQELPATDVVYYYLRQLDLNGTASRSSVISVALVPTSVVEQALPLSTSLAQNYPNPFNPETTIQFDLAVETPVSLRVYDMTGQVVRTLVSQSLAAGSYTQLWDGTNEQGVKVGSGVYFYELKAGAFGSKKKMTLLQ